MEVLDPLSRGTRWIPRVLNLLQTVTIAFASKAYDAAWGRTGESSRTGRLLRAAATSWPVRSAVAKRRYDTVIATHTFPCIAAVGLKSDAKSRLRRVFAVPTDFALHGYWPTSGVDGYFVAHTDLVAELQHRGVARGVAIATGIPLRRQFAEAALEGGPHARTPEEAASRPLRVLIMAGGLQQGSYRHLRARLLALVTGLGARPEAERLELTVVAGDQPRLAKRLEAAAADSRARTTVLGFVEEMHELLAASDVVVTKPGGLMVAEALAVSAGLVLLPEGPGQEAANARFLVERGAALAPSDLPDTLEAIGSLAREQGLLEGLRRGAATLGRPTASRSIAARIATALGSTEGLRAASGRR